MGTNTGGNISVSCVVAELLYLDNSVDYTNLYIGEKCIKLHGYINEFSFKNWWKLNKACVVNDSVSVSVFWFWYYTNSCLSVSMAVTQKNHRTWQIKDEYMLSYALRVLFLDDKNYKIIWIQEVVWILEVYF